MTCRRSPFALALAALLAGAGCADTSTFADDDGAPPAARGPRDGGISIEAQYYDVGPLIDAGPPLAAAGVYAHSAQTLYRIDPDTLAVSQVARFGWPTAEGDEMTDIAIDSRGKMIGISYDKVYVVDAQTASCSYLAPLDNRFNGLSFVPGPAENDMLVAATEDGSLYEIDPATGSSRRIGAFGDGLGSSGDIVSVRGLGTVASVRRLLDFSDSLARIDVASGRAQIIGPIGFSKVFGLGFWKDKVYGFTEYSEFILIDVQSGQGQLIGEQAGPWWGAGVCTSAPVIL